MPPKAPEQDAPKNDPVVAAMTEQPEPSISERLKAAYDKGYGDGYTAAFPKPKLFEACRQDVLKLATTLDDGQALKAIERIMNVRKAEYAEFMPWSDRGLLFNVWARYAKENRREMFAAEPPRAPKGERSSREPFTGEPQFEYEAAS